MKAKNILKKVLIAIISVIIILALAAGCFFLTYKPTITFDAANLTGEISSRASGFLYGIAEDGVPSYNMVESIDLSSLATKTTGGLQHPIADMGNVAAEATAGGKCDYLVVYLQDMYATWYYDHENITEMKRNGTYDWREYVESVFFPMVEQTVNKIKSSDYHNKIVYCLYNECDNAVWFGSWIKDENNDQGGYSVFDDAGKQNFYEAWKLTYDYVKELDPVALIGGPGYCDYNSENMNGFLTYTCENGCTPDILIYHELGDRSIYDWQAHIDDLKNVEKSLEISENTPVIVSEYGRMQDNGSPNTMLKYITKIEQSGVYGEQAYWLLANNLCNTAADYNTPNSAWWVYRWYADMEGQSMNSKISDMFHSDFEKAVKEKREFRFQRFMGLGSVTDEKDKLDILVAGADYKGNVKIKNLSDTALKGKEVYVKISAVTYQGISGMVFEPEIVRAYKTKCGGTLRINLGKMDEDTSYHIEVCEASEKDEKIKNDNLYTRYEFENGTLLGNAYTYDSAYATTGEINGMVGGNENEGDGVEIKIRVPETASYDLMFIYGNANDGIYDENGRQNPDDRTFTYADFMIDGEEQSLLEFENTIRSEITTSKTLVKDLKKGSHTIRIMHNKGTYVLDSLLVKRNDNISESKTEDSYAYTLAEKYPHIAVLFDADRTTQQNSAFVSVAPEDGYYDISTAANAAVLVDGLSAAADENGLATVFLRRGLNYIEVASADAQLTAKASEKNETAQRYYKDAHEYITLSGTARYNENERISYIDGITSEGGSAVYNINVPQSGEYKLTLLYSNNEENGVHSYNVDLVEEFVNISVNGRDYKIYCRNTASWDTYTTITANIELVQGNNTFTLYNDGSGSFNGGVTSAPRIANITISPAQAQ